MHKWLQMLLRKSQHSIARARPFCLVFTWLLDAGWVFCEGKWLIVSPCLAFVSIGLSTAKPGSCILCKKKKKWQQSESAAWLKVAQSNIDCLLFCHPALSRLLNKHSLVSLHLCLKSTFCVPFRHSRALRQLLSLLHKWNKSPLCKKWWGHGKKKDDITSPSGCDPNTRKLVKAGVFGP